jgi:hypothetical protein
MGETKATINVLVRDEYTLKKEDSYTLDDPLIFYFEGKDQNLQTEIDSLEKSLNLKIDDLVQDLYRIAVAIYVWDLQIPRGAYGPRYFSILISVSDKEKWEIVKDHLEGTLRFLTGDTFDFHFVQGKHSISQQNEPERKSDQSLLLFSGGLDSLAGFKWMMDKKMTPLMVSHPAMGLISGVQKELFSQLENIVGKQKIGGWFQIRAGPRPGSKLTEVEITQFSRSFLYLTMGATIALSLGIKNEFVCENGIIALNIPLAQSRIYSNTRTVHPRFISMYQQLLNSLFGHRLSIINPFATLTKGEVVKFLDDDRYRDLVKVSISCPNVTRLRWKGVSTSKVRHCGTCFPCIIRRIATHHAGLSKNDALYQGDITGSYAKIPEDGKKMLLEMMDFSRQMEKFSNVNDALLEVPQFYVGESIDPAALFETAKRQVAQFRDFLVNECDQSLRQSLRVT